MKKIYKIAIILLFSQNLFAQRYNVPLNLPNYDNKPIHSATAQSAEQASDAEAVHSTQIDWNRVDLNDTTHRFQAVRPVDDLPGYDQTLSRSVPRFVGVSPAIAAG